MHQATDQVPTPTQTPTLSREPSENDKSFPTSSAKGDKAPSQKKAEAVTAQGKHKKKDKYADLKVEVFESRGIWNDIYTMRWMRIPGERHCLSLASLPRPRAPFLSREEMG
jgi:hypothetical protein